MAATITTEVNGEQTLVFALPERHRSRPLIRAADALNGTLLPPPSAPTTDPDRAEDPA